MLSDGAPQLGGTTSESSTQLGDRPCFFKEGEEVAENLGFPPPSLPHTFCPSVAFLKMLGLLGEPRWGRAVGQGHRLSLTQPRGFSARFLESV